MPIENLMMINPPDPFWIWKDWLTIDELSILLSICKYWAEIMIEHQDQYWEAKLLESFLFRKVFRGKVSKIDMQAIPSTKILRGRKLYEYWKQLYFKVKRNFNPIVYITRSHSGNRIHNKVKLFGNKIYHCTKYWSYFNQGTPYIPGFLNSQTEKIAVLLLKDRGFTLEIRSYRKGCRAFTRSLDSIREYYYKNMMRLWRIGFDHPIIQ